jgi:hypothetical protein
VTDVAAVLDTSALLAYVAGHVAVGELIAEISDERRHLGVPAVCLASARAAVDDAAAAAHLRLLTTTSAIVILPLSTDRVGGVDAVWHVGELARAAGGDLSVGHAARAALEHEAYYATTRPDRAAAVLPPGWGILDLAG